MEDIQEIRHRANEARFASIDEKLDVLLRETAYIRELGQDSEVFLKWLRRFGFFIKWVGSIAIAIAAIFGFSEYLRR